MKNRTSDIGNRKSGLLHIVRIETARSLAPIVDAGLELLGMDSVAWYLDEQGGVRFEFYFESRREAIRRLAVLRRALREWAGGEPWSAEILRVSSADWSEYWKRFFHTTRVSDRITIKPSWESHAAGPDEIVIEIDPGMAFGTGRHFSTASCLRLMESVADSLRTSACSYPRPSTLDTRPSFLDIGCGSGILSIAAAKLGFRKVTAVDNDPAAVEVARRNFERNGVSARVETRVMDLAGFRLRRTFDVVAANLFSGILEQFAPTIAGTVRATPPGRLILAGILSSQYERIRHAYERAGLKETRRISDREWTSGLFRRAGDRR